MDFLFFVDLLLSVSVYGFVEDGEEVTDKDRILQRFLSQRRRCLEELCAVAPWELLAVAAGAHVIPILRLLKLVHFTKASRFFGNFAQVLQASRLYIPFALGRMLFVFFTLYLFCHWVGCLWILVGETSTKVLGDETSWLDFDRQRSDLHVTYAGRGGTTAYIRSIYWVISATSTVAPPDILPITVLELTTVTVIIFFGCQMFNAIVSTIAALISLLDRAKR